MRKYNWHLLAAIAGGFLSLGLASNVDAQVFSDSGPQPSFTAEQAAQGRTAYASNNCARCHGETLDGNGSGPPLANASFRAQWRDQKPSALFGFIASAMPPMAPGSLSVEDATTLTAFIMERNGLAPGALPFVPPKTAATEVQPLPKMERQDAASVAERAKREAELAQIRPVTDQMLRDSPNADWLMWRGSYAGLGYSPLHEINKHSASRLTVASARSLSISSNETTPLVHDGVIFIKSGNRVVALDGVTGDELWEYVRTYPNWMNNGATEIVKNLAIFGDKLYVPFLDGHMLALNVKTGNVAWDHVLIGAEEAASRLGAAFNDRDPQHLLLVADGGPIVANGEVVVGVAGCSNDYKGGCFIVGLNAVTGKEDWRFNTIARPGQPGGDSWNGAPVEERYGGSVWFAGSYDPDLDLLYFGIGQTYHLSTLLTPQAQVGESNDALYTDSTVALKSRTGELAWYYQHFNADVWDLDWAFEQTLMTLPIKGTPENLVVTAGKIGVFDALDRGTGKYAFSYTLGMQNIVVAIDPETGKKSINPIFKDSPPDFLRVVGQPYSAPTKLCPYARTVPSTAFDPTTSIMYVPVLDASCADPKKQFEGMLGRLEALDMRTGKVAWIQRHRAPEASSVLVTAGGVVIEGSLDRRFSVYDSATGKVLWETHLDNAPKATPVTYSVRGKQYIAVIAGGALQNYTGWAIENPTNAETLWIFTLPDASNVASN